MTDDERLLADLATKVRKLTDQVAFRDMLLTQIKYDFKQERAAVVAYLRAPGTSCDMGVLADAINRGEHRTSEEYALGFNVWEKP